jgi:hypothetical protein
MLHCEFVYCTTKVNNAPNELEKKALNPFHNMDKDKNNIGSATLLHIKQAQAESYFKIRNNLALMLQRLNSQPNHLFLVDAENDQCTSLKV